MNPTRKHYHIQWHKLGMFKIIEQVDHPYREENNRRVVAENLTLDEVNALYQLLESLESNHG